MTRPTLRIPALLALTATAIVACTEATSSDGVGTGAVDAGTTPSPTGTASSAPPGSTSTPPTAPPNDGGADAGQEDATEDGGVPDAASDATIDATPDGGGGDPAADAGVDATTDAGGGPELVSPANCPRGIVHHAGVLYWTETAQPGLCPGQPITPGIRKVAVTGSTVLPPQIYVGAQAASTPSAVSVVDVAKVTTVFFTDGQGPHNDLWRLEGDGGVTRWGPEPGPIGPTALVGDGEVLYWTSSSGTHLSETASPGRSIAIDTGIGALVGGSVQSVALDTENVYSIRNQAPNQGLYACARGKDCSGGKHQTIALETELHAVASDGTSVWFTGGSPTFEAKTVEKLFKCPASGCAGATPVLFAETATDTNGNGNHHAIAVDEESVYWSTIEGVIYRCKKDACASPAPIAKGVRPASFAQDKEYLYWADRRGGIYRLAK